MFAILADYLERRLGCFGKIISQFVSIAVFLLLPYEVIVPSGWPMWLDIILIIALYILFLIPVPVPLNLIWLLLGVIVAIFTNPVAPISLLIYIAAFISALFIVFVIIWNKDPLSLSYINRVAMLSNIVIILFTILAIAFFIYPVVSSLY